MGPVTKSLSWWHRCATLGVWLILMSAFASIAAEDATSFTKSRNVCLSAECVHTASMVLSKMRPEIEPCNDFYQFACGKFSDEIQVPEDKVAVNTFSGMSDKIQEQLRDIMTEERSASDPQHLRLPNQLYRACMNTSMIEKLAGQPIKRISGLLGGWPVIVGSSWDRDNYWTWQETVTKLRHLGFSSDYLFGFSIGTHLNKSKRIIYLRKCSFGLEPEYLRLGFDKKAVSDYYNYMVDMAVLFGAEKEAAKNELRQSLEFEIDLAVISHLYSRDTLTTVERLQESYPYVHWKNFINGLLPKSLKIGDSEEIVIVAPDYFSELGNLLQRTNKRVIANYMMWRIHAFSVPFLSEEFRSRKLQYENARRWEEPRSKECFDIVSDRFGFSVESLYLHKYFQQDSKTMVVEIVDNLRNTFSEMFDQVNWMDNITKQAARQKLHTMTTHIGYPDEMLDNELVQSYRKLEINPDKYFESILNISIFDTDSALNKLRLPLNNNDQRSYDEIFGVKPILSAKENIMNFPAGFLQGHAFNSQRPKYMNYGAVGYIIASAIKRFFDGQSCRLQPDTLRSYMSKQICVILQFDIFIKQTGMTWANADIQGINVADNGGIKMSYLAYNKWVAQSGEEPRLPGLIYTPKQMFWISAAQVWCTKYKDNITMRSTTDASFSNEFRVLGTLRNMKEFSRDYQCPEGAPMNPVQKCEAW